ncbi:MAG: four helix bundle protein [Thermoanaerobaculia bacterium]
MQRAEELKRRSKRFALDVIRIFRSLPRTEEGRVLGRQLLRSGTAVGANYRAACRARSHAEFVAKIGTVVEEIDEAVYWIELLSEAGVVPKENMSACLQEANELLAIFAASQRTARKS